MDIGLLGGSFDPPHLGHLNVARDAREALGLDQVWLVPAHRSPFKAADPNPARPEVRRALCEAAVSGESGLAVWEGELHRPPPSYTVDTLEELQGTKHRLTLLMGQDQWAALHRWRNPRRIFELARVGVLTRAGYEGSESPEGPGPWPCIRVPVRRIEISSTEVRERRRAGRSIRYLVPDPVRRLIEIESLYGSPSDVTVGAGPPSSP
ncbi:MAG: nicotinate (nicotinamide) nucleotide adenylyltransferase [Gemmatimonadota bacterium]